MSPNLSS